MVKKRGKTKGSSNKRKTTRRRDPLSPSSLAKNARKHGGVGVLL